MSVPVEPPCCWQAPWRLPCPRPLLRKRPFWSAFAMGASSLFLPGKTAKGKMKARTAGSHAIPETAANGCPACRPCSLNRLNFGETWIMKVVRL